MTTDLIQAVRDHARRNYNRDGWDMLVECWEDRDIVKAMGEASTVKQAIRNVRMVLKLSDDYRREIESTAF